MTRNQILYQQNVETNRANTARETETQRSNMVNEAIARDTLAETYRANLAREQENTRSNLARELETAQHNRADEGIRTFANYETQRSNLAREFETNRSNVERENETARSNLAQEAETNRSNLAKELENTRHNMESEQNTATGNVLSYQSSMAVSNSRVESAKIQAAARLAERQLIEEGLDSRQATQLVSDNIQFYTDQIRRILDSDNEPIKNLVRLLQRRF